MFDPDRLNAAILEMLAKPPVTDKKEHDHALACVVDSELDTIFPMLTDREAMARGLDLLERSVATKLLPRAEHTEAA